MLANLRICKERIVIHTIHDPSSSLVSPLLLYYYCFAKYQAIFSFPTIFKNKISNGNDPTIIIRDDAMHDLWTRACGRDNVADANTQ